jgi:hypothetical protein
MLPETSAFYSGTTAACDAKSRQPLSQRTRHTTCTILYLKAQLDGAWLGSVYVITDVIDKESFILYKFNDIELCIKVLEPHGTALGSTPVVSGNERFFVNDVSYDVKRAEPRAV